MIILTKQWLYNNNHNQADFYNFEPALYSKEFETVNLQCVWWFAAHKSFKISCYYANIQHLLSYAIYMDLFLTIALSSEGTTIMPLSLFTKNSKIRYFKKCDFGFSLVLYVTWAKRVCRNYHLKLDF